MIVAALFAVTVAAWRRTAWLLDAVSIAANRTIARGVSINRNPRNRNLLALPVPVVVVVCSIPQEMIKVYQNFPKERSYNFFATALECGSFGVDIGLNSLAPQMKSDTWLTDYYCGSQQCPSLDKVVGKQAPLTSLSLYGCGFLMLLSTHSSRT